MTPPVWAPVEVKVDPEARQLSFNTLEGHPLRGTNVFRFSDSEEGTQLQSGKASTPTWPTTRAAEGL